MAVTAVQMCFHSMFFAQGLFVSTWSEYIHADLEHIRNSLAYPAFIFGGLFLYGVYLPGNHSDVLSVYTYPIYNNLGMNCLFVQGAWLSVYAVLWLLKSELNQQFDPSIYKLTTESSLSFYVTHTLFGAIFLTVFIVPFKDEEEAKGGFAFLLSLFGNMIFTELACFGSYIGFCKLERKLKRRE